MRIRTQLILAAFVLAVLPLAAIVTYSYHSSRRALESAYRREAERATQQMDQRLAAIRSELDQGVRYAGALPIPQDGENGDAGSIVSLMGKAAPLVRALDYQAVRDVAGSAGPKPETQVAEVQAPDESPRVAVSDGEPAAEVSEPEAPVPPSPPSALRRVVIEIPDVTVPMMMSEEQQEILTELSSIGALLAKSGLDADERKDLLAQMREAERELNRVMRADRARNAAQRRELEAKRRALIEQHELQAMPEVAAASMTPVTAKTPAPAKTPATAPVTSVAPVARPERTASTEAPAPRPRVKVREATPADVDRAFEQAKKASLILGRHFQVPVRKEGEVVGQLSARISVDDVIRRVLGSATEQSDEIPFAIDREGTLYTRNDEERARLDNLGISARVRRGGKLAGIEGWIVSLSTDRESGLKFGAARPVGQNLDELRKAAARNFGLGLGLIAFALIGIVPLSNHLTRDVAAVTEGAERIAHGDLQTRLPVKTDNELGQLARAFNRMAEDLSVNQQKLLDQERARREQELQQRLLSVEYERKSVELEDARRFQLSMLPKEVPQHDAFGIAVYTRTATEVGGDYYDFHVDRDRLSVTIGDATGHGAKAGTMVTVVKTLFAGYSADVAPSQFLGDAAAKIRRMELGRMAMALSLARFDGRRLTIASAGMPPVLVHRREKNAVEEIILSATPLGTMGDDYPEAAVDLASGDTVLFLTDGFPELMNDGGQQLGYTAAAEAFAEAACGATASDVIDTLAACAHRWHGDLPPNDDVTFVVVRVA